MFAGDAIQILTSANRSSYPRLLSEAGKLRTPAGLADRLRSVSIHSRNLYNLRYNGRDSGQTVDGTSRPQDRGMRNNWGEGLDQFGEFIFPKSLWLVVGGRRLCWMWQ